MNTKQASSSNENDSSKLNLNLDEDAALAGAAFAEIPGLRGIRVAELGAAGGKTLQIIEGVKDAIIPMRTCEGREQGRVLRGGLRFMRDGHVSDLNSGDRWDIPAGATQGPHVVLEAQTRVLVLREGDAALG